MDLKKLEIQYDFYVLSFYYNELVVLNRITFENVAGKLCEALIPVRDEYCMGRKGRSIAVCTLASIKLLEEICKSPVIMDRVLIVGRLLSENRGIDAIVKFTLLHEELRHIILCGKESRGHQAGQALLSLHQYGIMDKKSGERFIIGAKGHYPRLKSSKEDINSFRIQIVRIHNLVGIDNLKSVQEVIESIETMSCV